MRGLLGADLARLPSIGNNIKQGTLEGFDEGQGLAIGRRLADLSDVVVYVEGPRAKPRPGHAIVTMKGKAFAPRVLVVGVGTTVDFPNEDPIFHNVFSVSGDNR